MDRIIDSIFKPGQEVSFVFKGVKLFGMVKENKQITLETKPRVSCVIVLLPPISINGSLIREIEVLDTNVLTHEKLSNAAAKLDVIEIKD